MTIKTLTLLLLTLFLTPDSKPSPALAGIAHVAFRVTDVPKSREFYRTLGFEEAFGFADPGKPPVSYVKVNDHQFIELYGRADESQSLGLMHLCYEANDIEAVHAYYVEHGVKAPEPRKARAGNLLFVFRDPENQIIEFTQYMPGSLHYEDRGKHLTNRRIAEHMAGSTISTKDVPTVRSLYASQLGFEEIPGNAARLRVPGGSGDEIDIEAAAPDTKPFIRFAASDLARTEKELRSRGLTPEKNGSSVSVTDPDGAVIEFVARSAKSK
jgi:catechol 2,3-dioxygenase-like lactoylglutathione lyase family enzyme